MPDVEEIAPLELMYPELDCAAPEELYEGTTDEPLAEPEIDAE
jgi:hypothetical protein